MRISIFLVLATASAYVVSATRPDTLAMQMPAQWTYTSEFYQTSPADDNWWRSFNDPLLDSLISRGIDNNFNVAIAARRINIARQAVRQAKAGYYPQIDIGAGWSKTRQSGNITSPAVPPSTTDYFSASIDMAWEIDLFGRINSQVRERKAQYNASAADYLATMNSLCAEIATCYIQLRTVQEELDVTRTQLASQEKVLKIADARHEAGLNSGLDVAQASTVYYSTESSLQPLYTSINRNINMLALLLGCFPDEIKPLLESHKPLPDYRRLVGVGVPADLLRRRPDVRAAEYDMAAAAAATGIAKKDFLPTLTLDGSVGVAAHDIGDMFTRRSITYSITPRLSWTIFDGMARNASLATAREQMQIAIDNYNLTILTAVEETDNALSDYTGQLRTIASLETVVQRAQKEMDLSLDLYKQGLSDFLSVAQAQITLLEYTDRLVAARGNAATALITLYKALGGGWHVPESAR